MRENDQYEASRSTEKRRRILWIVIAHVLIVATFFIAPFFWGNFE